VTAAHRPPFHQHGAFVEQRSPEHSCARAFARAINASDLFQLPAASLRQRSGGGPGSPSMSRLISPTLKFTCRAKRTIASDVRLS